MDWKKIGKKLLFPPVWLMILLTTLSAVLLTIIFVNLPFYIIQTNWNLFYFFLDI